MVCAFVGHVGDGAVILVRLWLWLLGSDVFALLVQMTFDGHCGFRQMLALKVSIETRPSGKLPIVYGLYPYGGEGATTGGLKELDELCLVEVW
jgi:hypothetical protein